MNSGIYRLTWPNNNCYIGKSNNIARRMDEHVTKFLKGTAAKNLQAMVNLYGLRNYEVLYEIHEDHIDLIEDMLIEQHKAKYGTKCLNTSQRKRLGNEEYQILARFLNSPLLKLSTAEHIKLIKDFEAASDDAMGLVSKLQGIIRCNEELKKQERAELVAKYEKQLEIARSPTYKDDVVFNMQIDMDILETMLAKAEEELHQVRLELVKEQSKTWWTKLWE